jgi:hypothetical protein
MIASNEAIALSLLVAALVTAVPAAASAAPAAVRTPSAADLDVARELHRQASALARQGKQEEALAREFAAYRAASTPITALELGRMLIDAKRIADAYDVLVHVPQIPVSPRESEKGRAARQDAAKLAASLRSKVSLISVAVRGESGLEIDIDGERVPAESLGEARRIEPGVHTVTWRRDGRTCGSTSVTIGERESRTVEAGPCSASETSAVSLQIAETHRPPERAPPPLEKATPPVGTKRPHDGDIRWGRWIGIGAGAAGIALVGAGAYIALDAKSDYDSVAAECGPNGCTRRAFDIRDGARDHAGVASVMLGLGAAAIVGGAIAIVVDEANDARSRRSLEVAFSPFGVSLRLNTP